MACLPASGDPDGPGSGEADYSVASVIWFKLYHPSGLTLGFDSIQSNEAKESSSAHHHQGQSQERCHPLLLRTLWTTGDESRGRCQYLQDIKLGCLDFGPGFLQPCHWTEVHASWRDIEQKSGHGEAGGTSKPTCTWTLTYDGHHGVEVADVEAFSGHINEELQHAGPVFLLYHLETVSLPRHGATKGPLGKDAGTASDLAATDLRLHLQRLDLCLGTASSSSTKGMKSPASKAEEDKTHYNWLSSSGWVQAEHSRDWVIFVV